MITPLHKSQPWRLAVFKRMCSELICERMRGMRANDPPANGRLQCVSISITEEKRRKNELWWAKEAGGNKILKRRIRDRGRSVGANERRNRGWRTKRSVWKKREGGIRIRRGKVGRQVNFRKKTNKRKSSRNVSLTSPKTSSRLRVWDQEERRLLSF